MDSKQQDQQPKAEMHKIKPSLIPLMIFGGIATIAIIALVLIKFVLPAKSINPQTGDTMPKSIYLGTSERYSLEEIGINETTYITNNKSLVEKLDILREEGELTGGDYSTAELDYQKYDYILLAMRVDECSETDFRLEHVEATENGYEILYTYHSGCGLCALMQKLYLLPVKKNSDYQNEEPKINVEYHVRSFEYCSHPTLDKPVIYLYPEQETNIEIRFTHPEKLAISYPSYQDSWRVIAKPDGTLIDQNTGRELYSLYYEGYDYPASVKDDGFVVKSEDLVSFFEEKLAILGLNNKEAEEFIIYWLPIMQKNAYNYIHFDLTEDIDRYMPLELSEEPDTVIRFAMTYKALDKPMEVKEQKLKQATRQGFTLIEWGGSIIE